MGEFYMLTRRHFLAAVAIAAAVSGCDSSNRNLGVVTIWRGRRIEVYAEGGVSTFSGTDQCEFQTGEHVIVVRETEIAVDGTAKTVGDFTRVVIDMTPAVLTVTVDDTTLFG